MKRKEKKKLQLRNKKLLKMYPWLIPRNVWTGKIPKDYDYTYTELDCMPEGWKISFGKDICKEIQKALEKVRGVEKYRIQQIKEKYGQLRWYSYPAYEEVERIISDYSHISEHICHKCGKPDVPMLDTGWICPECEDCFKKNKYYRDKKYEDYVISEDNKISDSYNVTCYYSKDNKETITYDISNKVEKVRKGWEKRERKREKERAKIRRKREKK